MLAIGGFVGANYSVQTQQINEVPPIAQDEPCGTPPAPESEKQEEEIAPPVINGDQEATPTPPPETQLQPQQKPEPVPAILPTPSEICTASRIAKQLFFTFDAGAGNDSLSGILNALEKHNAKATFFVTGAWAKANQTQLQQISSKGHEIYNHTYTHPNLTLISNSQIIDEFNSTDATVQSIIQKSTKPFFRPPYGARNKQVLDVAWSQGYRSVYWSVDTLDWQETATASSVKNKVMNNLASGNIYLMHIGSKVTGQVIDEIFNEVVSRGYKIDALSHGI
jgi:peptidoglycan/xylan/chitin deacetylase (PgdA/CDA1 family)